MAESNLPVPTSHHTAMQAIETAQLLAALAQQNQLLIQILDRLKQPKLGLVETPSTLWIYANRSNNCPWYTIRDGEASPVLQSALTGYLSELKFEKVERRGKETIKLQAFIKADRPYCVESGYDSHFSKGLLSAVAMLTPEQVKQPITIAPQPGSDESVLFCRVFIGSEPVRATYDEETDWRSVSQQAMSKFQNSAPTQPVVDVPIATRPETIETPTAKNINGKRIKQVCQLLEIDSKEAYLSAASVLGLNKPSIELTSEECTKVIDEILVRWGLSQGCFKTLKHAQNAFASLMDSLKTGVTMPEIVAAWQKECDRRTAAIQESKAINAKPVAAGDW